MYSEIAKIMEEYGDNISVFAKNISSDRVIVSHKCNKVFRSPTVMKILIMIEALIQVEEGRYKLDEEIKLEENNSTEKSLISDLSIKSYTLKDLIVFMMTVNDYKAINTLIGTFGMDKINKRGEELDLIDTKIRRMMLDFKSFEKGEENVTSIRDMANLLEKICKGKIFKEKELFDFAIDMLSYQRVNTSVRGYFPGKEVSYKTGEIGEFYHDIGIVFLENNHYILGVFVDDALDTLDALDIIGRIKKVFLKNIQNKK